MTREHPTSLAAPARRGGPKRSKGGPQNLRPTRPAAHISIRIARGNNTAPKRHPSRAFPPRRANSPVQVQPPVHVARPNPSRINTSANLSFFIKSLIMNDLKSIRISVADNKSPRINTSNTFGYKPLRINTSKKHPGGGGVKPATDQAYSRLPLAAGRRGGSG
jgi:hypothetical protein